MTAGELLLTIIDQELEILGDTRRIIIGGMSQGCIVSLAAFLSYTKPTPLGGVLAMSGIQSLELTEEMKSPERQKVQS